VSARAYPRTLPTTYAREKLATMQAWSRGDFGRYLAAFWPREFPGMPLSVVYGFCSNGGLNDNTGTSPNHAAFAEIGAFGVPAGPWNVPAPSRDTSAQNEWLRLHANPRVVAMLGRSACVSPGCYTVAAGGVPDQTAVGVVMLADDLRALSARLPDLAPSEMSPWAAALTCWAWSAGSSGAATVIRATAPADLASVPESTRFWALGDAIAQRAMAGSLPSTAPGSHNNPAHGWTRTAQKLAAGRAMAPTLGEDPAWYGPDPSTDPLARWVADVNARASVREPLGPRWPSARRQLRGRRGRQRGCGRRGRGTWRCGRRPRAAGPAAPPRGT
jgi:hypothetical protein